MGRKRVGEEVKEKVIDKLLEWKKGKIAKCADKKEQQFASIVRSPQHTRRSILRSDLQ